MIKKIFLYILISILAIGSILGIVFTAKYFTEKDSTPNEDMVYIQTLETRIDELSDERLRLLLEIAELEEDNAYTQQLREQISELNSQIDFLQEEINRYAPAINIYNSLQSLNKVVVEFYFEADLYDIYVIDKGQIFDISLVAQPIVDEGYVFSGWCEDGYLESFDFSQPINTNMYFVGYQFIVEA